MSTEGGAGLSSSDLWEGQGKKRGCSGGAGGAMLNGGRVGAFGIGRWDALADGEAAQGGIGCGRVLRALPISNYQVG